MTDQTLEAPAAPKFRTEEATYLPLNLIQPSPHNPRKRFDQAKLEQLADSIEAKGVQQAIVVRRLDVAAGAVPFEIVAGERRWRASKLVEQRGKFEGPAVVPAFIRVLDDFEAREIALMENTDRDDLHPLEQAQGYEDLLLKPVGGGEFSPKRLRGYTVEQLAERIGHEPNFVFGRLKLLQLTDDAKEAFLDGKLQLKTAETLARLPAGEQERALPQLLIGWAGEPYTHRQAVAFLRDNFALKLSKARFEIADARLVEKAGACTDCPKRSSSNPGLFGDTSTDDMCLDGACFKAKTAAHAQAKLEQLKAEGATVLTGKAAKKLLGGYSRVIEHIVEGNGYSLLDKPAESLTGTKKALRTLLGDEKLAITVVQPEDDDAEPVRLVKTDDARAVLKAKGLLMTPAEAKAAKSPGGKKALTVADVKAQRDSRLHELMSSRLPGAVWAHLSSDGASGFPDTEAWLRHLANKLYDQCELDFDALERAVTGSNAVGRGWIDSLDAESLARVCIALMLCDAVTEEEWRMKDHPEVADGLAADIKLDLPALRGEVKEEVDSAIRDQIAELAEQIDTTKPARKAAAKKAAPAKKAPTKSKQAELTPEKALAAAVNADGKVDGEKLDQVAWPFPGDRSAQEQIEASARRPTLSPEAAWPFPDSPDAPKDTPAAATKPSKARKPKAAKSAEVSA